MSPEITLDPQPADQPAPAQPTPETSPVQSMAEAPLNQTTPGPSIDAAPTTPLPRAAVSPKPVLSAEAELLQDEIRRKWLLGLLVTMLFSLCGVGGLFYQYLKAPRPLPEMLPQAVNVNYPPHYLFSIYNLEKPVGVAMSPAGDRIYVTETSGERQTRVFDRQGSLLFSFAPPHTESGERSPVYISVDPSGRIYVAERLQHAVYVYDADGNYLDTILDFDLTLSEYLSKHLKGLPKGISYFYNIFRGDVIYKLPGQEQQTLPAPNRPKWSPLGLRFDPQGDLWLTDVSGERHTVREYPASLISTAPWTEFASNGIVFGITGQGRGQFLYPNVAVKDSQNRIYVADGNNGRISMWDTQGNYLFEFAKGTGDGAISLPRGAWIDSKDRLHVVDAVGHDVKVYDVSGPEPVYLYTFGGWGVGDGLFNFPNDIVMDNTGRLYIVDRENNRVQVWSY